MAFHELWRSNRSIPEMGRAKSLEQLCATNANPILLYFHIFADYKAFRIYPQKLVLAELRRATPPLQSSRCVCLMFGVGFGGEKGQERIVVYFITLRSFICPQAPPSRCAQDPCSHRAHSTTCAVMGASQTSPRMHPVLEREDWSNEAILDFEFHDGLKFDTPSR